MHAAEKFIKNVFKHYWIKKKLNCEMKCYEKQFLVPQCNNRLLILNCYSYYNRSLVFNSRRKTSENCLK